MTLSELLEFIALEDGRLTQKFPTYQDPDRRLLCHAVKLSEEVGELCNEVLAHGKSQREEKLAKRDPENAAEEIADVLIVTLLIATSLGVDVDKALVQKMDKINRRYPA